MPRSVRPTSIARLTIVLGLLFAFAAQPVMADSPFRSMATEIIDGIRNADIATVPAASGYGRPTIAVQAFRGNEVPVPTEVANSWNRRLLAEMQRQARGQFQFVDRATLPALIRDIERSARSKAEKSERIDALKRNARADILITGAITLPGAAPVLSYQAIGIENGRLLATASPQRIPFPEKQAVDHRSNPIVRANDTSTRILRRATGFRPTVLEAERLLVSLGYRPGPVDGILTVETRDALRAYQADSALPVNGRMTWNTVENMRRDTR